MSAQFPSPACSPVRGKHWPSLPLRLRWAPALIACALATACGGGDPSQDSLVAVGSLGAAASGRPEANNVAALAHSLGAMEARLAAVEGRAAITAGAAAGTYRLLSMSSKTYSGPAGLLLGAGSGNTNATVVLRVDGTFTYSGVDRMSGFRARLISCNQVTNSTSPASGHIHSYSRMNCSTNGFISSDRPTRETSTGAGTWRVGPGNTLVITPSEGGPLTVYLAQGGAVGFSVSADDQSDAETTGTRFNFEVLVKQ